MPKAGDNERSRNHGRVLTRSRAMVSAPAAPAYQGMLMLKARVD